MKALVGSFVIFAALVGRVAAAQTPTGAAPPARAGGTALAEALLYVMLTDITLSSEQQTTVDTIRARARRQTPALPAGTVPDSAARRQLRDVVIQVHDQIRAVLTPEQQKQWDRNLAELRRLTAPDTIPR
jgi:hypothetical protein